MPKSWILFSSDHNTFTQFSSESLANFRQACTVLSWAGGPCGRCRISVLHSVVLPIVFLVTIVLAALRSLTRSSCVVPPPPPPQRKVLLSVSLLKQTFCSFFNLISSSQQNNLLQSIIIYSYIYIIHRYISIIMYSLINMLHYENGKYENYRTNTK